jgi:small subunit ribosomal protein S4
MARYLGPVCRLCRREGEKLFLKGERCYTGKCAVERRPGAPGVHGQARQSTSGYKTQLREKQKTKRIYGLVEKGFKKYYTEASRRRGVTGSQMLIDLERRLDNIVYRLGFGFSRRSSRQLVSHGLVLVNGKPVTIASFLVREGDSVEVIENAKKNVNVQGSMAAASSRIIPEWLSLDKDAVRGTVVALPKREQFAQNINEQLIVELYSR